MKSAELDTKGRWLDFWAPWRRLAREPILLASVLVIAGLLALLVAYPLLRVALKGFEDKQGNFSLANFAVLVRQPVMLKAIRNSALLLAISVPLGTLLSTLIGYLLTSTDLPGRKLLRILVTLPMIFPPFTGEMGLLMLWGRRGLITYQLLHLDKFNIYGAPGIILLQTIGCIPMLSLMVSSTFAAINREHEEAAQDLGAGRLRTLLTVTLPLALPGILSIAILHFITILGDFGTPLIVGAGFSPLAVEAYSQLMYSYNFPMAAALSTVLLFPALIAFIFYQYVLGKRSFATVTGQAKTGTEHHLSWYVKWPALAMFALLILWNYSQLVVYIVGAFVKIFPGDLTLTLEHFITWATTTKQMTNSLWTSLVAAVLGGVLAAVLAYLIIRQRFPGRKVMDFVATLPWGVPGTVKGVGYILAFNRPPLAWTGTYYIIVLMNIARSLPLALRTNVANLAQIDASVEEASLDLGASRLRTFARILVPLIRSSFLFGIIYIFKDSMTNLTSVIMLMSPKTELFYPNMFRAMSGGATGNALAQGLEMFLVNIVLLMILAKMGGKSPLDMFQI